MYQVIKAAASKFTASSRLDFTFLINNGVFRLVPSVNNTVVTLRSKIVFELLDQTPFFGRGLGLFLLVFTESQACFQNDETTWQCALVVTAAPSKH